MKSYFIVKIVVQVKVKLIPDMYKTRNTGTGNGMRGTRGIGEMLYSGECRQTFRGMSSNIPGNVEVSIHQKQLRQLTAEIYKSLTDLSSEFIKPLFYSQRITI